MSKYYNNNYSPGDSGDRGKRNKHPWVTVLKVFCWCIGILIVLCGIAFWIISYNLEPERITKLIEEKSSLYLKADIKIGKLKYKLFSSYPWLKFEIDSLTVISKSLEELPMEQRDLLPGNADSLAFIAKLKGEINVHGLIHKELIAKGIIISEPRINIVMVNDSVNNFNIAPLMPKIRKTPKIDISEIKILPLIHFNFLSVQDSINAKTEFKSFFLAQGSDKRYNIGFEGIVSGSYKEFELPVKIPLNLNTTLKLDPASIAVNLNHLSLTMGGLSLEADGKLDFNPKMVNIETANITGKIDDIFTFITFFPKQITEKIPIPEGLAGKLPVEFNLDFLSPFQIAPDSLNYLSLNDLPSITGSLIINDANLSISPPHEKKVEADDIYFEAIGNFNPNNPEDNSLQIKEMRMQGEGISINGNVSVNNLLGENQDFDGDLFFSSPLIRSLSYLIPESQMKIAGLLKGKVIFSGKAVNFGKEGLKDLILSGDILANNLQVNSPLTGNITLKNLKSDYKAQIPAYPLTNYAGTKMAFDLSADSVISKSSGINLLMSALKMKLDAIDTVSGTPDPNGDLTFKAGTMKLSSGSTELSAQNIIVEASGSLNSGNNSNSYSIISDTAKGEDALLQNRVDHTPIELVYNGGSILSTIMNLLSLNAEVSIEEGEFKTPEYLYPVEFNRLDLSTNLNRVQFSTNNIKLSNSSFAISGVMNGLKPFMTSYSATPLNVSADIDFQNVDINQLSWGYYGALMAKGESQDSVFFLPAMTPLTKADSICVLIPRNIDANLRLRAASAEYLQYRFSPLSTDIIVKNGDATLSKLTVGAPYCTAIVDWTYSTSHIDNIYMNLMAKIENFSSTPFYEVFPTLLEKAPELHNFTGLINANIGCKFLMFPDMFMNPESLEGEFDIKGSNMEFARQGKIERITHLMLIEGNEPIKIQNMDIQGSYHDNLLQINPFKVCFDNYELEVGGINNTAGEMYYHLALEKSPFHLPFGVTLAGKFKHPEVRLGGTHINDYKAEMVNINPSSKINANIMVYLKHGWLLFVQEAAKYEGKLRGSKLDKSR